MLAFTLIFRHSDALALSADVEGVSSSTSTGGSSSNPTSPSGSFNSSSSPSSSNFGPDNQTLQSLKNTAKNVLRRLSPTGTGGGGGNHHHNNMNNFSSNNNSSNNYFHGGNNLVQIDLPKEATFVVLLNQGILYLTVNCVQGTPGSPSAPGAVSLAATYLEEISREFGEQYGQQAISATRPFMFMRFDNFLSKTKKVYAQRNSHFLMNSNNNSNNSSSGGRQQPTKISFYKLMGLVEPPGFSLDGGNSNNSGFGSGFSSQNVKDAKHSLTNFANSLARKAQQYNVPGAKKLNKEAMFYLSLGVGIIVATFLALYLVFYFFG